MSVAAAVAEMPTTTGHSAPMIRLQAVEKVYRTDRIETVALTGIDFAVREGEFVSIMGPSGCGKSTLLNIIGLLDVPTGGRVELHGSVVSAKGDRALAAIRNKELGFVFQTFHLIPDLAVVDNVEIPLLYRRLSNGERRKLAEAALDRVGLSSRTRHFPSQLSGGPAAASGHRAGDRRTPQNPPRRRAHGQSRQPDGRRGDGAAEGSAAPRSHDGGHGHPRCPPGRKDRAHHPAVRRPAGGVRRPS